MVERTLAIIKPDAIVAHHVGAIIGIIENNDFQIIRMLMCSLTKKDAERFYAVHKNRSFFDELTSYMSSGPIIVLALEKENAVAAWRTLMGDTNPANAQPGTIRNLFGTNIGANAVHGSDSLENAQIELAFFFPDLK